MKPALALLRLYAYAARELPPKDVANLFANPQTERDQIEKWVKTEYGADWQWALHQYKTTGKVPATGVKH